MIYLVVPFITAESAFGLAENKLADYLTHVVDIPVIPWTNHLQAKQPEVDNSMHRECMLLMEDACFKYTFENYSPSLHDAWTYLADTYR